MILTNTHCSRFMQPSLCRPKNIYLLLPMSMMTILELECWRASSNQVVKWLKVSLLLKQAHFCFQSDTREKPLVESRSHKDFIFTCTIETLIEVLLPLMFTAISTEKHHLAFVRSLEHNVPTLHQRKLLVNFTNEDVKCLNALFSSCFWDAWLCCRVSGEVMTGRK